MISELEKISKNYKVLPTSKSNLFQISAPYYDLDGDLFEVFFEIGENGVFLTDAGTTLMRLSYSLDYETEKRLELIKQIVYAHEAEIRGDVIWKPLNSADFEKELNNFVQILAKISNMRIYARQTIRDLFYEELNEYVLTELNEFSPEKDFYPLGKKNPYKVDYKFNSRPKPIYMFGVNTADKARLTTITCLKLITSEHKFQSLVIFKDIEEIPKNDRKRLLNASDKVFTDFSADKEEIKDYFRRSYSLN